MNCSQVTVNILQNPKYAGAIDSVSQLTDWIGSGLGMAITLVTFLIILVAMFKNVLTAAYCAYPKFWDRVDTARKEVGNIGWIQQFEGTFTTKDINSGSFSNAIVHILPNIKTLADFEGDTIRPKTYSIRAIPQMLLCVIIGAFIYNGYYCGTTTKVIGFGSEMVSRVLLEVDPITVLDQLTGSTGRPMFASDGSELPQQKLIDHIATEVYGTIVSEYSDIENINDKRAIANTIRDLADSWVAGLEGIDPSYTDEESWKSVLQASLVNGAISIDHTNGVSASNDNTMQYVSQSAISTLDLPSTINAGKDMYIRIRLNFEKDAVSNGKHAVTDLMWYVGSSGSVRMPVGSDLSIKNTTAPYTATQGNGSIEITIQYVSDSGNRMQGIAFNDISGSKSGVWEINSSIIVHDSKNSRDHKITSISFGGNNTLSSANESHGGITWGTEDLSITSSEVPAPSTPPSGDGAEVE